MKNLSIVIPCFNEQDVIEITYKELSKELNLLNRPYELIFIDDGSKDETFELLKNLHRNDNRINVVSLSRNFGKEGALLAGFRASKGDIVVIMDADLQDPPHLLKDMIRLIEEEGFDQVGTYRESRKSQSLLTKIFSHFYYKTFNSISDTNIRHNEREYRALTRAVVDKIIELGESTRYNKLLWSWIGFKTTYIGYEDIDRVAGKTKYNIGNKIKLAIDNITFSTAEPLRLVYMFPILYWLFIFIYAIWDFSNNSINIDRFILLFGFGLLFSFLAILARYMLVIYYESKHRPAYIVKEIIEGEIHE